MAKPSTPKKTPYKYKVSYSDPNMHPEGLTAAQLEERGLCGTDALFMASILYPPDGALSVLFRSFDGRKNDVLDDHEWFKVWMMLSRRLSLSKTLDPEQKDFAKVTWDAIREMMMPDAAKRAGTNDGATESAG